MLTLRCVACAGRWIRGLGIQPGQDGMAAPTMLPLKPLQVVHMMRRVGEHGKKIPGFSSWLMPLQDVPPTALEIRAQPGGGDALFAPYTVPERLLPPGQERVCLGTVVALADEISTHAGVLADRTCRPGVSVQLSAAAHAPLPRAGDKIDMVSWATKVGKSLGFMHFELRAPDGAVLASGRHIKALAMPSQRGVPWNWLFGPTLLPYTMRIALQDVQHKADGQGAWTTATSLDEIFDPLPPPTPCDAAAAAGEGRWTAETQTVAEARHANFYGTMHGGAQAMRAHAFAAGLIGAPARSIHATYLNPVRKGPVRLLGGVSPRVRPDGAAVVDVEIQQGERAFEAQFAF